MKEEILEIRTAIMSKKAQIVIPNCLRKSNPKFKEGSKVLITIFDDRIEIKPLHQRGQK